MPQTLTDFESGSLSSSWIGDTGSMSVTTNYPYEGSYAVDTSSGQSQKAFIYWGDKTFSTGETPLSAYVDPVTTGSGKGGVSFWFAADGNNKGYRLQFGSDGSDLTLQRQNSTDITDSTSLGSVDISGISDYHKIIVSTWDSSGNITIDVGDGTGSVVTSLNATDTTYTSGYVGFGVYSSGVQPGGDTSGGSADLFEEPVALSPPSNVTVSESSIEDELTLDWDSVSSAAGYYVYRAQSSGSSKSDYTQIADVTNGTTYTDTALEDGERYYYRVSSHD